MTLPFVGPLLAVTLAFSFGWRKANDLEEAQCDVWKRVAYATRYGKGCTLTEAASLPAETLSSYIRALAVIVEEENKSKA